MDRLWIDYRNKIIFNNSAENFDAVCDSVLQELAENKDYAMIANLAIDLGSYLPRWIPGNADGSVTPKALANSAKYVACLEEAGQAELAADANKEIESLKKSNLIAIAEAADEGKLNMRWGNDNGLGVMYATRRGAAFITTNPPITNMARKAQPEFYDKVRDEIVAKYAAEPVETRIARLTMNVVLNNCRALRGIYEYTDGNLGYAHYQVNPNNYQDTQAMIDEVMFVNDELSRELGGPANVLFKLPGTKYALEAVRAVTAKGIGVTVTVNFAAAQCYEFAKVIQEGTAKLSTVVMMSGRLDGPVADDLKAAGVEDADLIARNASRAVTYKVYNDILVKNNYKAQILTASLRGPWNFDASCTANPAARIMISAFPDKWAEYDEEPRTIEPLADVPVSEDIIKVLEKSDVFNKAYYVEKLPVEDFDTYKPVVATLTGFIDVYNNELKPYMGN